MTNSFPSPPADLQIQSVVYVLNFGGSAPVPGPAMTFTGVTTGMYGAISGLGSEGGITFAFTSPGNTGSFDQTAAETAIAKIATDIFQLISDLTGVPVATLATNFTIARRWAWTDAAGNQATYADTMPYTPPA